MKTKKIMYRRYVDLLPQEKRFYTINREYLELNECNKCEEIESTYDLYWDCDYNLKSWNCLCKECYEEEGGEPFEN